jgi:hypothetical protein
VKLRPLPRHKKEGRKKKRNKLEKKKEMGAGFKKEEEI